MFYMSFTSFYILKTTCMERAGTFGALFHLTQRLMRIFAFLIVCLSLAAYGAQKTSSAPTTVCATAEAPGPATNILFQSADGGKTWQDLSRGLPEKLVVNCVFSRDGEVFLGTNNGCVYHSRDLKKGIWSQEVVGGAFPDLSDFSEDKNMVTGIFSGRSGLYACVYKGGLFRRIPATGDWQPIHLPLNENIINTVAEDAQGNIFVGCQTGVFKSGDDGKTWKHVFDESWVSELIEVNGILVGSGVQGLLRSTDDGEHWTCTLPDKGAVYNTCAIEGRLPVVRDHFAAVRVGGPAHTSETSQLRNSVDGGENWQRMDEGLFPLEGVFDLKQAGDFLFCTHKGGISRSADWGQTWELVRSANDLKEPLRFELSTSGKLVFAAIVWGGC